MKSLVGRVRSWFARKPAPESIAEMVDPLIVPRPQTEKEIAAIISRGENLVIYGPARQGKTTLLSRQLKQADVIYIECRPDFKRSQIYRVALASLGYAMLVEKKKRGKVTTTVKLGPVDVGGEGELEQVMQSVTVDLKNPSEVAHLISRLKRVPYIVLNNFQLLDRRTKQNFLFDLVFFAERSRIRFIIVGSWSNEEYLEEIEPGLAGKLQYVYVSTWSANELSTAYRSWSSPRNETGGASTSMDELLTLADGDISLFRALAHASLERRVESPQSIVIGRFRRGLSTRLAALLAERGAYLSYLAVDATLELQRNLRFQPIAGARDFDYSRTDINPDTQRPYSDGRKVRLDAQGNTEYIERLRAQVVSVAVGIAPFLLRRFHEAVSQGGVSRLELAQLSREFVATLLPTPVALNESRLKRVLAAFGEVQRQALIVPPMLSIQPGGDAIELIDRRLLLFLQSISLEELDELLFEAAPRERPQPRRRNRISDDLTVEQRASLLAEYLPEARDGAHEGQPDEPTRDEDQDDDDDFEAEDAPVRR